MRLTVTGKVVALLLILGASVGLWRNWSKIAPRAADKPSVAVTKINLPTNNLPNSGNNSSFANGFTNASSGACPQGKEVRLLGYAWNAQMGMHLSSGGAQALAGSSMCKHDVNFHFARQDDNSKLQEALVTFATELSQGNAQPKKGAHFVTIMGDGGAAFIASLDEALLRIGPEYEAKIVDAVGYSRGEDKFMGPVSWKQNPATSKGGVVAGVLRDGDWNIAQKWLGDNGLRTNPDEKTWDPDALNWVSANDYIDAVEKYVAGYSETRPVVHNGQRTGETKRITVNGVVTWTPGDVTLAKKKGGLVSIVSTKEYSSQMPCVVIGINKWCQDNRGTVENMILAIAEGGRQIKTNPAALQQGAKISAALYNEANAGPDYWAKYFKGTQERDATGQIVELGGSSVNDLADSMLSFGLLPGSANLVATTYTVFGDLVQSQYPELVPNYPSASQVLDASYLSGAAKRIALSTTAIAKARPVYKASNRRAAVVSKRVWRIQFNAGKATFTPETLKVLDQLSNQLLVAGGTMVEVHGHTDNQGDPRKSLPLSQARAQAVENWLERRAPVNFPQGRVRAFAHGEAQPLYANDSAAHRALNRRVEIVLRSA